MAKASGVRCDAGVAVVVARLVQSTRSVGRACRQSSDAVQADVEPAVEYGGNFVWGERLNVRGGVRTVGAAGVAA